MQTRTQHPDETPWRCEWVHSCLCRWLSFSNEESKGFFVALLEQKYKSKFKGTGPIQYYLGMNFERDKDETLRYIATKYIEKMVDLYEQMFGEKPFWAWSVWVPGWGRYSSVPVFNWITAMDHHHQKIGCPGCSHDLTVSSIWSAPHCRHLDRAKRVVGCIWQFQKACIWISTGIPDFSMYPDPQYKWMDTVYEGTKEQLPHDAPPPLGKPVMTTTYVDANLMHDMLMVSQSLECPDCCWADNGTPHTI